jgi:hypothetical protein
LFPVPVFLSPCDVTSCDGQAAHDSSALMKNFCRL